MPNKIFYSVGKYNENISLLLGKFSSSLESGTFQDCKTFLTAENSFPAQQRRYDERSEEFSCNKNSTLTDRFILATGGCWIFIVLLMPVMAQAQMAGVSGMVGEDASVSSGRDKQVVDLNRSLKNSIEENQKLMDSNQKLESDLDKLRADMADSQSRYDELKKDRDDLTQSLQDVKGANRKYAQDIKRLEADMDIMRASQQQTAQELEQLKSQQAAYPSPAKVENDDMAVMTPSETLSDIKDREEKTTDLVSKIDAYNTDDVQLKKDSARAHYNMGNIYFQKGDYELAAREYYQSVILAPDDPDGHFNLAFVSGEHLRDYATAFKHYKMYLYLNPDSKDINLVKAKIIEAELQMRNTVDSPLEKDSR